MNDRSVTAVDKLSIYIPQEKRDQQPLERLHQLAQDRDRSVNYLVSKALEQFVEREEEQNDNRG